MPVRGLPFEPTRNGQTRPLFFAVLACPSTTGCAGAAGAMTELLGSDVSVKTKVAGIGGYLSFPALSIAYTSKEGEASQPPERRSTYSKPPEMVVMVDPTR